MKLKISRTKKKFFLVVSLVLTLATAIYLIQYYRAPRIIEEKYTTYEYNSKSDVTYKVALTQNILYDENIIDEGKIYITEFIDQINTSFHYRIDSDQNAKISGDYQIIATVEGYTGSSDQCKTIWERKYILLSPTSFNVNNKSMSLDKNISLNLKEYIMIAEDILKQSKINTDIRLKVEMPVNYKINSGMDTIEKAVFPAIEIPLDARYFEITKTGVKEEPGKIEETNQISLKPDNAVILICSLIMVALVLFMLYLQFFTFEPTEEDLYKKSLNIIFKMHGNRLVALNSEIVDTIQNYCVVKSMDDLIRIADEISKPIMYEYNIDTMQIKQFYVFDETRVYIFELEFPSIPEKSVDEDIDSAQAV